MSKGTSNEKKLESKEIGTRLSDRSYQGEPKENEQRKRSKNKEIFT